MHTLNTRLQRSKAGMAKHIGAFMLGLLCLTGTANAENRDEVVYFFNDALGSAVAAVDENGDLCWSELYTPYGDKTVNDDLVNRVGCGIVGEERGYTGHTEDVNSDLVYMQQRYYDPSIGRFLSIDPQDANPEEPATYNRYAYANNNPYKYVDPDGEFPFLVIAGFIAKEVIAEYLSAATGGASELFSARRVGTKVVKAAAKKVLHENSIDVGKKVNYSSIKNPKNVAVGKDFTLRQKQEALELNRKANGGVVKSDLSSAQLDRPQKSQRGVTPSANEWQFDHKTPKNCGGTNCSSNLQILSRQENRSKSDTLEIPDD